MGAVFGAFGLADVVEFGAEFHDIGRLDGVENNAIHSGLGKGLGGVRAVGFGDQAVRRSAAVTQFDMSMAMVIGPTPPGTGVIAVQRSATAS